MNTMKKIFMENQINVKMCLKYIKYDRKIYKNAYIDYVKLV